MNTLRQMAQERRDRKQSAPEMPPTQAGEQWGKCVGVYEVNRGTRARRVARVLLASGLVVTGYFAANAPAPAVDSNVLVAVAKCPPDEGHSGCFISVPVGPGDVAPANYTVLG